MEQLELPFRVNHECEQPEARGRALWSQWTCECGVVWTVSPSAFKDGQWGTLLNIENA